MKTPKTILLLDSVRGQYIPRDFVQGFDLSKFEGISEWDEQQCQDPENEHYWDAWEQILNNATYTEDGRKFTIHQDGDLWLVCIAELTKEEHTNMFGYM